MARNKGTFQFAANFEVKAAAALDGDTVAFSAITEEQIAAAKAAELEEHRQ